MSIRDRMPTGSVLMESEYDDCIVGIQDGFALYNASKMAEKLMQKGCPIHLAKAAVWKSITLCSRSDNGPRFYCEI